MTTPSLSMRSSGHRRLALLALALLGLGRPEAFAQQTEPQRPTVEVEVAGEAIEIEKDTDTTADDTEEREDRDRLDHGEHRTLRLTVHVAEDAHLPATEAAEAVVTVFGDSTVEGEVDQSVVAVFGNTRVTGRVHDSVVAVFGDVYLDSAVARDVVAVFGNVELGPRARVDGEAVAVGGKVTRDPQASVRRGIQEVGTVMNAEGLRSWFTHALRYARLLAFEPGLGWAWGIALGFLALYVVIALLFNTGVEKCVATLETRPGQSVVASLLTMLLIPILSVLLVVTLVGIAVIPFFGLALFCAGLFGKTVMLAALGRRLTRFTTAAPFDHIAFAVLVGGLILLAVYVVPVLGIIAYKVTAILGLGVVAYTLLLALQARRMQEPPSPAAAGAAAATAMPGPEVIAEPAAATAGEAAAAPGPTPAEPASASVPTTLPRAGFWIRIAALVVDVVLIGIVTSLLKPPDNLFLILLAGYGALMWKLKGTTVGGIIFDLKVVRADGRELQWDTALVRALSCFLSLAVAGLGFIWIAFDDNRQAWHDKIAGTLVVRTRSSAEHR
jgi:uncharacterized RDD family membrane protein YckC